jgi:hypothetical protein
MQVRECLRLIRTPSFVVPIILFPVLYCALVLFAAAVSPVLMVVGTVLGKVVVALAQWAGMLILSVLGGLREVR